MRNQIFNYSISASSISSSQIAPEKIQAALEKTGLQHILVECLLDFEATVETYPDKEIAGFARRCEIWLLHRGSDDTAQKLAESCRECGSDNPKKIARAMYEKVCGHGMISFEAAEVVCNCIAQNSDSKRT